MNVEMYNEYFKKILKGNLEHKIITQVYGEPATGKTCYALQCLINYSKKGKKVVFIDTEGGFSIERLKQMAGEDFEKVFRNVYYYEVMDFSEQHFLIENLPNILRENCKLIILDSAVSLYRIASEEENANKMLSKQMATLAEIARKRNLAVLITNHVYTIENRTEPVGGNILKYWSKTIIEFKKEGLNRIARLVRHRFLPENLTVKFRIIEKGIEIID